jgi:hypothetical protein
VLALAALAGAATWVATRHGPGMSPDSVTYLSAARNLASGHGYTDFTGQALTTFPPGFPALVAVARILGVGVTTGVRLVNAVSFAATVLLAWRLIRRHVSSLLVALGATALVAVSPALINVASNAWSESLFCALVLGFILALEDATEPGGNQARSIAAAAVLAGLAFLVRYAGLSLFIVGSLALVASSYREGWRVAARRLAEFSAVGLVIPAVWLARNAGSGTRFLFGPRVAAPESWGSFIGRFADGVGGLFTPTRVTATVALVAVALGVGGLAAYVARNRRPDPTFLRRHSIFVLVLYVAVYSAVVVASGKIAGASVVQRIVTPGYVPALILGAVLVDVTIQSLARRGVRRRVAIVPGLVVLVALAYVASTAASFASLTWSNGEAARGYTKRNSSGFELVRSVETLAPGALVATNRPWTLFAATGREPIVPSPGVVAPELALTPILVAQLSSQACSRPVYLAWFTYAAQWPYTPAQLATHLDLVPLRTVRDGVLYSVRPRDPDCSETVASNRRPAVDLDAS